MDKDQKQNEKKRNLRLVDRYENDDYSRFAAPDYAESTFDMDEEEDPVHHLMHPDYPGISSEEATDENQVKAGYRGIGPKGYKRTDAKIYEEVCEVLMQHRAIDASNVAVKVTSGLVNLSGKIDSRYSKKLAEELIDLIPGVTEIQNELSVMRGNLRMSGPEGVKKKDLGIT
jgi:osmotically-inducible protein OsmY